MIPLITFLLGLCCGLGIYYQKQRQFKFRLQEILTLLSYRGNNEVSLPLTSKIRREILQLQDLLEQQRQQLVVWEDLLNEIPLGYLQVDQENQLLWCNFKAQEILKILDWQPTQLRLLLELVRSYELDQLIQRTRQSQENLTQTWEFYPKDFENNMQSITLKGYSFPLLAGEVGVFIENVETVTAEARMREQTFADLTHELRTPLTSMALVTEALEKRLENPEKRWVQKMHQETQRLIQLVQQWLEISQINENPTQHLNYQLFDLREVILESWSSLEPLANKKYLELDYQGPEASSIEGDRCRLIQVFMNLFDNSIKNSYSHKKIQVIVKIIDNYLKIDVIDSGSGFSPQGLPYVFERLYRSDPSRSRESGGSGLGLNIVQQIMKAHGGDVKANNHPETGGAWLQLTLPQKK
ncbi:cell wall metabolism sensor histidine kinase WalK [Gloeocapsa sp. PCC 73106]|uniref:sensor histidine kinase n=1 Tax=Gloeocapsa sp. PCC 73106 TaxID=102232 RepID=UPI0002AD141E|nr:HAMP domain-containing sensor histidine kinase [Gloeocapsa sp. PCC 73106]ELR98232.1 histidine kinase [Gloeocapsa sp. PCC 73106]